MQSLRIFATVARHRSFSHAAQELELTQSAVSQRVGQLEKKLGVTLLDRSVRPLALTAAGEVFLRGALEIIEGYERLERQVTRLGTQVAGHVRVDSIYSAGIDMLAHVREQFAKLHPRVMVTIGYKRPEAVHEAVRHHECDLGIVSYPHRWRDVAMIPLRDERMSVVCAPDHELAGQQKVHASQLDDCRMAMFEPELPVGRHVRKYLREHGAAPQIVNVFDNIDTIKSAVAVTDEISILPTLTVLREVAAGTLVVIELEPQLARPMGIIHARRNNNGNTFAPAVQAFVDYLLQHAGPSVDLPRPDAQNSGRQLVGGKI